MTSITFFLIFIPILSIILLGFNFLLAPHNPYKEKKTPFECGYHSFLSQNRTQFTISFFIFALLFLIFDLEIVLIYPYSVSSYANNIYGLIVMIIFTLIVTVGFIFELGKNALKIESKQSKNLEGSLFTNKTKKNKYSGIDARLVMSLPLESSFKWGNIFIFLTIGLAGFCLKSVIISGLISLDQLLLLCIYSGFCAIPLKILVLSLRHEQFDFKPISFFYVFSIGFLFPLLFYGLGIKGILAGLLWGFADIFAEGFNSAALLSKIFSSIRLNHYIVGNDFNRKPFTKKDFIFFSGKGKEKELSTVLSSDLTEGSEGNVSIPITSGAEYALPISDSHSGVVPTSSSSVSQEGESASMSQDSTPKASSDLGSIPVNALIKERDSLKTSHLILSESTPGKPLFLIFKDREDLNHIVRCIASNPNCKQFGYTVASLHNSVELRQTITARIINIDQDLARHDSESSVAPLSSSQSKRRLSSEDIYEDSSRGESSKKKINKNK